MRRLLPPALAALSLVLTLAGCLTVQVDVTLNENGSGRVRYRYLIDEAAYDLGVFDDAGARPIPVSEREFAAAAQRIDGLSLSGYRQRRSDGVVTVEADLRFDSVEALRELFGRDTLRVTIEGRSGSWVQLITPGSGTSEAPALLADALAPYTLTMTLAPPSGAQRVSPGAVGEEGRAELVLSLGELLRSAGPVEWAVHW